MLLFCMRVRYAVRCTCAHVRPGFQYLRSDHQQYASQTFQPASISPALQNLVTTGRLKPDGSQQFAAQVLNALQTTVKREAQPLSPQTAPIGAQAPTSLATAPFALPRGAYLWGTIGSGKTMLMDLFCSSFLESERKHLGLCRLHFHEFMLTIHSRLHSLQESVPRVQGRSQFGSPVYRYAPLHGHPVDLVAQSLAKNTKVLCLDELHITDVADALILGQLFSALLSAGTVVLFTSNKTPSELYKNGLNRQYFLPFVKLIQEQLAVIEVSAANDYRLQDQTLDATLAMPAWHDAEAQHNQMQQGVMLVGPGSQDALEHSWSKIVGSFQTQGTLDVGFGRLLHIPRQLSHQKQRQQKQGSSSNNTTCTPAAIFHFQQVCGQQGLTQGLDQGGALGPADMVALAAAYPVLFIQISSKTLDSLKVLKSMKYGYHMNCGLESHIYPEAKNQDIPLLQWSQRNEARRLVTLIDTLYDMRCRLECSAAGKPRQIFAELLDHARRMGCVTSRELSAASAQLEQAEATAADWQSERLASDSEDGEPMSLALLQEEVVAYQRAISRLSEMCRLSPA